MYDKGGVPQKVQKVTELGGKSKKPDASLVEAVQTLE
jgi:hypothetical protein